MRKKGKKLVGTYVSEHIYDAVRERATQTGQPVSKVMEKMIVDYLNVREEESNGEGK